MHEQPYNTPDTWAMLYRIQNWRTTGVTDQITEEEWRKQYQVITLEPGKLVHTPTDETRKRLWVDVFYRGVQEIHCSANPDKSASEAAHRADLAVAEYDQRFGA